MNTIPRRGHKGNKEEYIKHRSAHKLNVGKNCVTEASHPKKGTVQEILKLKPEKLEKTNLRNHEMQPNAVHKNSPAVYRNESPAALLESSALATKLPKTREKKPPQNKEINRKQTRQLLEEPGT